MKIVSIAAILFLLINALGAQDENALKLWYKKPAANWNEALPAGNGRLGVMVFGYPANERIQLNEESLWSGMQLDNNNPKAGENIKTIQQLLLNGEHTQAYELSEKALLATPPRLRSYQPLGDLLLDFGQMAAVENYSRELNLAKGIITTKFQSNGISYKRDVFVSAPQNCIVVRMVTDKAGAINCKVILSRERDASITAAGDNGMFMSGQVTDLPNDLQGPGGRHMKFSAAVNVFAIEGNVSVVNNSILIEDASAVTILLTAATDYNLSMLNFDRRIDSRKVCNEILSKATPMSFDQLLNNHISEYQAIFGRVSLQLGEKDNSGIPTNIRLDSVRNGKDDPQLQALYFQFGRYLLMSSSRTPGVLPANLQGIWNQLYDAPWNSDYHTNINLEMNYWPAEVCNLSETVRPMINFVDYYRGPGRVTAQKMYHAKGWAIHHATDVFGKTGLISGVRWGASPLMGVWLCLNVWEHFLFTKDSAFLSERIYPIMKEAAEFVQSFLISDKEGHLVSAPSISPENAFVWPGGGKGYLDVSPTTDIELIRELYTAISKAASILQTDQAFIQQLKETLEKLPPIRVSRQTGGIQEWSKDYEESEPGHRHMSHLISLYPGSLINAQTPDLYEAAKKSIERRRNNNGGTPGWSCAWLVNLFARLKMAPDAYQQVQNLLKKFSFPNLFNDGGVYQIDGNLGGTAGIAEMLIQSHDDNIELLPALPDQWSKGSVKGLCARGGFVIDMEWSNGVLTKSFLYSKKGGPCLIRYGADKKTIITEAGKKYMVFGD